jgi:hypothetical protein
MSEIAAVHNTGLAEAGDVLRRIGAGVFAFAMVALGVETLICARDLARVLGPQYNVIPVVPWLPAISWLAYPFGAVWVACVGGFYRGAPCEPRRSRWAACCLSARWFSTFRKTRRTQAASPCAPEYLSLWRSHASPGSCRTGARSHQSLRA